MNGPSGTPDPNALTQPIPVVPMPPPPSRPAPRAAPQQRIPVANATVAGPYAHRFGSIPFYLFARFAAFVLDIFGVAFLLATFGYHATDLGSFIVAGHDPNGYATLTSLSLGIALLIAFFSEAITGTTLGKLIFALHTRRGNGSHAGALRVSYVTFCARSICSQSVLCSHSSRHVISGSAISRVRRSSRAAASAHSHRYSVCSSLPPRSTRRSFSAVA